MWAFPLVFVGFAILAGLWPFHTWAPTGHVAAPTAASMLLAGVVMKLGAYGCLRVAMTLFPGGMDNWSNGYLGFHSWRDVIAVLAVIGATGVALHEYAPAAVKLAAVGHGQADKDAIVWGVGRRLGLAEPLATDAADALALALCHLQHAPLLAALYAADGRAAAVARGPRSAPARRGSS